MTTPHDDQSELEFLQVLAAHDSVMAEYAVKVTGEHFFCQYKRALWQEMLKAFLAGEGLTRETARVRFGLTGSGAEGSREHAIHCILVDVFQSIPPMLIPGVCRELYTTLDKMRRLRKAMEATNEIRTAIERRDIGLVERYTESLVHGLSSASDSCGSTVHDVMMEIMEEESTPRTRGLPFSCLPWLSNILGGAQPGALLIIEGRRGSGKSALAGQIAWHISQHERDENGLAAAPVSAFSLELPKKAFVKRLASLEGVRGSYWNNGLMNEYDKRAWSRFIGSEIDRQCFKVYDEFSSIDQIVAQLRLDVMRYGMRVAIVDMIQRVKGDCSQGREQELSGITWDLKEAAKSLNITIIAMSHVNANNVTRGSEDIENHADQVVLISVSETEEGEEQPEHRECLIKIMKNRMGEPDKRCIHHFIGQHMRFVEIKETDEDVGSGKQEQGNNYRRRYSDE